MKTALALWIAAAVVFAGALMLEKYDAAIEREIEVRAKAHVAVLLKDKQTLRIICTGVKEK